MTKVEVEPFVATVNDRVIHIGYPPAYQEVWVVDVITDDPRVSGGKVAGCHAEKEPRRRARYWTTLLACACPDPA